MYCSVDVATYDAVAARHVSCISSSHCDRNLVSASRCIRPRTEVAIILPKLPHGRHPQDPASVGGLGCFERSPTRGSSAHARHGKAYLAAHTVFFFSEGWHAVIWRRAIRLLLVWGDTVNGPHPRHLELCVGGGWATIIKCTHSWTRVSARKFWRRKEAPRCPGRLYSALRLCPWQVAL